jgi:hypothetical protein
MPSRAFVILFPSFAMILLHHLEAHRAGGAFDHRMAASIVVAVEVLHLLLGDLADLALGDLADEAAARRLGALLADLQAPS